MDTPHVNSLSFAADRGHSLHVKIRADELRREIERATQKMRVSPAMFTGCVSNISLVEAHEHAYFDALKDYAEHYAEAQAYLATVESDVAHADVLIGDAPSELNHGLLGDDGEPAIFAQISDDEIDNCGYLGWLRH